MPPFDGSVMRTKPGGLSGTHSSAIVVMEQLRRNFPFSKAVIVSPDASNSFFNGVQYSNDMALLSEAFVLILPVSHQIPVEVDRLPRVKLLIFISQTYIVEASHASLESLIKVNNASIGMVYLNRWCEKYLRQSSSEKLLLFSFFDHIPNPMPSDVLPSIDDVAASFKSHRDPGSIGFFASYERGGHIAERVFCSVKNIIQNSSYHIATYVHTGKQPDCEPTINHGGLSKKELYNVMLQTRLFLYPLKLPQGHAFHKDMHPLCVTEALACGMTVITYPQSAMVETFGDAVRWAPVPDQIKALIQDTNFHVDLSIMNNEEHIQNLTHFVASQLQENDYASGNLENAIQIRKKYGSDTVGRQWHQFLSWAILSFTNYSFQNSSLDRHF